MTEKNAKSRGRQKQEGLSSQRLAILGLIGIFLVFGLYYFIPALKKGPDHVHSRDDAPKGNQQAAAAPTANAMQEIARLEQHLEHAPEDYTNLRHLGHLYMETRQPEKAVEVFRKAALVNPNAPEIYVELGVALRQNNQPQKSEEILIKMTESVPDYGEAWLQLAITYRFGLRDKNKALQNFEKYLALDGESPLAFQVRDEIKAIKAELGQ